MTDTKELPTVMTTDEIYKLHVYNPGKSDICTVKWVRQDTIRRIWELINHIAEENDCSHIGDVDFEKLQKVFDEVLK